MTLTLKNSGLGNPQDWSVTYHHPDGRTVRAGRIFFSSTASARGPGLWVWTVEFHQRKFQEEAKAAFRRCWESSDQVWWPLSMRRTGQ